MILDNAIYPRISIPFQLRIRFLLDRMVRFAVTSIEEENQDSVAHENRFKAIISRQNATISRICFSYSGSVAEFDDLRQDALINIWRGMQNFRGDSEEKTWIYRVTVNSCLSTIRKQSRHKHESLEGLYGLIESDDPEKEAIEQIHRVIGALNPQDKAIIMMWLDELKYEEIAEAMGLNRNTIATKIKRIKEKIIRLSHAKVVV